MPFRTKVRAARHALELHEGGDSHDFVLTCDHASMDLPPRWTWPSEDNRLVGTHWSYDIGAAQLTRTLADRLGCRAALARFSRLLVDPNRHESMDTLFRREAESRPVELNRALSPEEQKQRIDGFYQPYHSAIDALVAATPGAALLSVHTFTPEYEGTRRSIQAGVLFTDEAERAERFSAVLRESGYAVGLNEPYSGLDGLMYGIERHAETHQRPSLEIEIRQDIAADDRDRERERVADVLADATRRVFCDG